MKFEETYVSNFQGAFRGLRNPLQSWAKSDSHPTYYNSSSNYPYIIGPKDLDLAQRMIKAGTSDSKFLRQIFVSVDITGPLYWWKQLDTYKVATVANSTSTMHKISSTPITFNCFEIDDYNSSLRLIDDIDIGTGVDCFINDLEQLRQKYNQTKDQRYWKELIRWLPEGWLQKRTWTANYAVLRNIYFQRQHHRLAEWHQFCDWVNTLPYSKELITYTG